MLIKPELSRKRESRHSRRSSPDLDELTLSLCLVEVALKIKPFKTKNVNVYYNTIDQTRNHNGCLAAPLLHTIRNDHLYYKMKLSVCISVCMYVPKYLEKYRTYSGKRHT